MTTPFPFTIGQTLTAAQMNAITELVVNDKTASYTLVAGDAGERVIMNSASATTITVNTSIFTAGQLIYVTNKGAGVCTVTAGTATVSTTGTLALAQFASGVLYCISAGVFIFEAYGVAASSSGLNLVSTTTIGTTVSTVTVSSAFSATYDNYQIVISGGTPTADDLNILLQLGSATTGTFAGGTSTAFNTGTVTGFGTNNAGTFRMGGTRTSGLMGYCVLTGPFLAKATGLLAMIGLANGGINAGIQLDATSFTAFTISLSSGSVTGGTIKVYGMANS